MGGYLSCNSWDRFRQETLAEGNALSTIGILMEVVYFVKKGKYFIFQNKKQLTT
jgi:hypothetical protein